MPEPKSAIPKLIVFATFLLLGVWLNLPSPVNIGIMILKGLQSVIQFLPDNRANQVIEQQILFLRIFGWTLIVVDVIIIIILFRRREYFYGL